ncbi:SDR family oxidoreductase [candidate division FCPU426 bacterium]|nr:SDR family oxidoreductase [candidate division FCPU426 bacterium]
MPPTVFITGASRGIGKATAVYFHQKGWQVAATMRSPEQASDLAGLDNVLCLRLDVLNPDSIGLAIQEAIKTFSRIDVLVNNAGYAAMGPFEAASAEQIQRQFAVNVFGLMRVTQLLLPHFRAQKDGAVINISSIGGRITFPWYSLYNASKWTVEGFSEAVHHELRLFGIRVKVVEPGLIKTDFYNDSMDRISHPHCTAYDEAFHHYTRMMHQSLKFAATPDQVAKVVYRAAVDRSRKLRYPAAGGASLLMLLRKLLPDALFLRMMGFTATGKKRN